MKFLIGIFDIFIAPFVLAAKVFFQDEESEE